MASQAFSGAIGFAGFVSAPSGDLLSTGVERIISFTDKVALRINLVNTETKKAIIRLKAYDGAKREIPIGLLAEGISIRAGVTKQVILILPINEQFRQNIQVCAQLNTGAGRWLDKSCNHFQVQRVRASGK